MSKKGSLPPVGDVGHLALVQAKNFRRLEVVRFEPATSGTTVACGANAQGKTSLLDGIMAALGGAKCCPERPIRDGEDRGEVVLRVGSYMVSRRWTRDEDGDEKTYLSVSRIVPGEDGCEHPMPMPSPQAFLESLVGGGKSLAFDPLAFADSKPSEQVKILREVSGVDLASIDAEIAELEAERKVTQKVTSSSLPPSPAPPKVTQADVDTADEAYQAARSTSERWLSVRETRQRGGQKLKANADVIKRINDEISALEARIAALKKEQTAVYDNSVATEKWLAEHPLPEQPQTTEKAMQALANAKAGKDAYERHLQAEARLEGQKAARAELDKRIVATRARREELLAAATFPVQGLGFGDGCVTWQGRPLSSASSAERIKVSLAIAAALSGPLKVVLIREASLLDDEAMAKISEWAKQEGIQVFAERVGRADHQSGDVVLEIREGKILSERKGD